jgi:oxaloacetate decarboxylase (Na+ extruding) subunit alpha
MAKVYITDTILRDAHQSHAATRMATSDMLPAAARLDAVGYWSLECWGGATYDSCLRFLNEDPWDRLRALRAAMPNTKLQMLLRGQNLLAYKHFSDDVVDMFVRKSIKNGINVIRIFDALNDLRNMKTAMVSTKKYGGHVEAAISYTVSPVHTTQYFVNMAAELEAMGADTICIKDMANLLLPYTAFELVTKLKKRVRVPIHLHTHNSSGIGDMTLLKAIEAGVDIVDTALSPMANGTSQPATEPLVAALKGTQYDTGLDLKLLSDISDHFRGVASRMRKEGIIDPQVLGVDVNTLLYQIPGGMLSNLISQLKAQNAMNRMIDVMQEVPRVREDFGYPPLVTPTSQIVGTQAVMNVLAGGRYKHFTKESKALLRGEYGKLPAEPNPDVVKLALGSEPRITHRPADDIKPELGRYRDEIKQYMEQEEDILSYAMFPTVAMDFFKFRQARKYRVDSTLLDARNGVHPV